MKEVAKIITKNLKWIILSLCSMFFLLITIAVIMKDSLQSDVFFYDLVSKNLISDSMTSIMKFITWFGSAFCLCILTTILFIFIKNKKIGLAVIVNLCLVTIINQLLKFILQRPRPIEYAIIDESGYSFPSGHSMVSMAFYGFLIYLIYRYVNNKYLKWALISLLSLLIIFIGVSRIYLGVHFASDVCAGFIFSVAYLILYISVINKLKIINK